MERQPAPAAVPTSEKLTQPKETFHVTASAAKTALEGCRDNIDATTSMLNDQGGETTPSPPPTTSSQTTSHMELIQADRTAGDGANVEVVDGGGESAAGTVNNPIDLTQEDNALQKALALSLQDLQQQTSGAQISLEDQDISRALEASLAERQTTMQQLGLPLSAVSVDPLNPHERARRGNNPVGLKNIGNTCWFSAVVQSLFHIPEFREVVLQFQPPPLPNTVQSYHHCLQFLVELRRLFALLIGSHRKYINPERAIQALKAAFTEQAAATAAQQDVSEFTHKLLEWIEIAFKTATGDDNHNPVVSLFTGHCRTEGVLEGQSFINESDFGAFPIQVQGHAHLHDSLEAACVNTEMEQETWFTALPPILVLELSRFSFNQSSSMVEKLHSHLAFDPILALDRYMEKNKEEVRKRRKEVGTFRHKLQELRKRLNRYTHYQGHSVSVQDVLQLTLDFVREQSSADREEQEESEAGTGEKRPRMSVGPEPRFISPEERGTLEHCLQRWRSEMEEDIADLKESVSTTESSLAAVYSDEGMNATLYHLHAVLVHQGQASGGHYWAYIRKPPSLRMESPPTLQAPPTADSTLAAKGASRKSPSPEITDAAEVGQMKHTQSMVSCDGSAMVTEPSSEGSENQSDVGQQSSEEHDEKEQAPAAEERRVKDKEEEVWLKFNDVSVHEIGWEEVMRESYGGDQNTSAYCLLYISPQLHHSWSKNGMASQLPLDLQYLVEEDNVAFQQEREEYDANKDKIREANQIQPEGSSAGQSQSLHIPGTMCEQPRPAGLKLDRSPEQMQVDSPPLPPVDTALMSELSTRLQEQYQRLRRGEDEWRVGEMGIRLSNICSYLILSGLGDDERVAPLLRVLLLQAVEAECEGGGKEGLRLLAKKEIVTAMVKPGMQNMLDELRGLHSALKVIIHHFVYGVHALAQKRLEPTLVHSAHAYHMNHQIVKRLGERAGVDPLMLGLLRRNALQEVGSAAFQLFEQGKVRAALEMADHLLVPALKAMAEYPCPGDESVVEKVREEWCNCLMHPSLSEDEQGQLADLLTRMFEEFSKSADLMVPPSPPPNALDSTHLSSDYSNAVQQFKQLIKS